MGRSPALAFMSAVRCAAFRSAALPVGGSRRVATEVNSSIFAKGCFQILRHGTTARKSILQLRR